MDPTRRDNLVTTANALLSRLEYKPESQLRVWVELEEYQNIIFKTKLSIDLLLANVEDPALTRTTVGVRIPISDAVLENQGTLLETVYGQLVKIEMHEVAEWLKLDGTRVKEPHV